MFRDRRTATYEADRVVRSDEGKATISAAVKQALATQREAVDVLARRIDTLRNRAQRIAVLEAERQRMVRQRDLAACALRKQRLGLRKALRKETKSSAREELRSAIGDVSDTLKRGMPQNDTLREVSSAFRRLLTSHRTSDGRDEEVLEDSLRRLRLGSAPVLPPRASDSSKQPFDYLARTLAEAEALAGLVEEFRHRLEPITHMEEHLSKEAALEKVDEAESHVRRKYSVMRRVGFAWTKLGIGAAFETWRASAHARRRQRLRAAKRDDADARLRREAADAGDRLR